MLCSVFSPEDTEIWDGSSRVISPCKFLAAHYSRMIPLAERLLHIYGKKLTDLEGADIVNALYIKLAMQESVGVWSPPSLGTDADAMSRYVLGTAKKMIEEMNEKRFEYQEVSPDTPWGGSAVDEVLEREELQAKRSKTLEKVTSLLLSLGIDAEELYRKLDSDEADTVVRNLPILFGVCYTTSGEMAKLRRLFEDLGETEP